VGDINPAWSLALGDGTAGGMKLDPHGNLIVMGATRESSLTVGGQTFAVPVDSRGDHAFVISIDPSGNVLWSRIFPDAWEPSDFALDGAGNIYLVGTTDYGAPAPPDLGLGPISGPALMAKLDPQGNTIWSHDLWGIVDDTVFQVTNLVIGVDPTGQIAIMGTPSNGAGVPQSALKPTFLAFYDPSGTYLSSLPAGLDVQPGRVKFDDAGDLVVAGTFQGPLGLGTSATSTKWNAFVVKMAPNHDLLWSFALGDYSGFGELALAGSRTFLGGTFEGSLSLGGTTIAAQGSEDGFIATIDDGTPPTTGLFARYAGRTSLFGLEYDGQGGLWVQGATRNFIDYGTGVITPQAYVAFHLDGAGRTVASAAFETWADGYPEPAVSDAAGNLYLFGAFTSEIDLGTGPLVDGDGTTGWDLFLAKYAPAPAAVRSRTCPPPAGTLLDPAQSPVPTTMALAGQTLAFTTGAETMTLPIAGGTPSLVATAQKDTVGLAVAGSTIYWANVGGAPPNSGSIVSAPLAGGTPTVLAAGQGEPVAIATDGTNVYWTTAGTQSGVDAGTTTPGAAWAVPIGGGTPTLLANGFALVGPIAAANGVVVFAAWKDPPTIFGSLTSQSVQIMKVSPTGGNATVIANTDRKVTSIAVDATAAYWTDGDTPEVDFTASDGRVRSVTLDGAQSATLASSQPGPGWLSLLGQTLVWCNGSGVWSMPAAGGTPTAIASGPVYVCAADPTHVAWVTADVKGNWKLVIQAR
jgi:hypothetical protein